jgi:hypothetical protein
MDWVAYYDNLLGEKFGKVLSICRGGSWLYTPEGKVKICVPRFVPKGQGEPLEGALAEELLEDEVLFVQTDRGIIVKDGRSYLFYPEGRYELIWKK